MNKQDWELLVSEQIEELRAKSWEVNQDLMIDAFEEQEAQRLECFSIGDDVGYKQELVELFNSFQGAYSYEASLHFTAMAMFES